MNSRRKFFKSLVALAIAPKVIKLPKPLPRYPQLPGLGTAPLDDIITRAYSASPWMSLLERGTYPAGLGEVTRRIS